MAEKKREKRGIKHGTDKKLKPVRWEYDILIKDFIPRQYPREVPPTGIFDETLYCLRFNELWLPHILGALQLLLEKDSWSGGDAEIFRAQQAIYTMLANIEEPCGSGELRFPEFRSIPVSALCDQPQWKYTDEPDTAWRDFGTTICDGQDGDDGAQGPAGPEGDQGPPGEPGQDCECPDPNPPITGNQDDEMCGIAEYVIDKLLAINDEVENNIAIGLTAAEIAELFLDQPGSVIGAIYQFTLQIFQIGLVQYQATFTVDRIEGFKCDMYCVLQENGGVFDAATTFPAWIEKNREREGVNINLDVFYSLWTGKTTDWWNARAAIGAAQPSTACDLCECVTCSEELFHNFVQNPVVDDFGWSLVATGAPSDWSCGDATFNAENTWSGSRTTSGWTVGTAPFSMGIQRNFGAESFTLCKAFVNIGNSTGDNNTRISVLWVKRASDGVWQSLVCQRRSIGDNNGPALSWEGDGIEITDMLIACGVGGGTMTISRVELNYTP
jgi:hypothetical protein